MTMYATCRTADCANNGIGIDVGDLTWTDEETGEQHTIENVACGPCRQPITELTEAEPAAPSPNPLEEQADG
jgi:hypothetical protein